MISGIGATLAGLFAFRKKIDNAASNVANSNTDNYKKTDATITEGRESLPDVTTRKIDSPGALIQESDGIMRETSNVELSEEIPQMMIAQRGYEANLKALKTQEELLDSVIDIMA